jgi:hypothetical protein
LVAQASASKLAETPLQENAPTLVAGDKEGAVCEKSAGEKSAGETGTSAAKKEDTDEKKPGAEESVGEKEKSSAEKEVCAGESTVKKEEGTGDSGAKKAASSLVNPDLLAVGDVVVLSHKKKIYNEQEGKIEKINAKKYRVFMSTGEEAGNTHDFEFEKVVKKAKVSPNSDAPLALPAGKKPCMDAAVLQKLLSEASHL